eukprot:CAMPEP_0113684138 /NCGR_PEP_ID=MMETSP0038_2-20120614/13791_1 /TAXON_ID=2898 /ORGANISM="Cryptomonas paramecium" /LENGTH=159 /DNA_ID=CAMNT_0000603763 /DNA_START=40 /DNA_END=516 /DNA_ORIENTATION=+ /assembly_acc=CAM_ASM_000170
MTNSDLNIFPHEVPDDVAPRSGCFGLTNCFANPFAKKQGKSKPKEEEVFFQVDAEIGHAFVVPSKSERGSKDPHFSSNSLREGGFVDKGPKAIDFVALSPLDFSVGCTSVLDSGPQLSRVLSKQETPRPDSLSIHDTTLRESEYIFRPFESSPKEQHSK